MRKKNKEKIIKIFEPIIERIYFYANLRKTVYQFTLYTFFFANRAQRTKDGEKIKTILYLQVFVRELTIKHLLH